MSHVTNIMISFPCGDYEETTFVDMLNRFTTEIDVPKFSLLGNSVVGGNKNFECNIFVGAFNYFPLREFSEFIDSIKGVLKTEYNIDDYYFEDMQIFIKEQDSDRWELYFASEIKERYK